MIFVQVLIVIFAYALNSAIPNEIITRFLLHTSILLLILNLLIEKLELERKKSILAALAAIMILIPFVFLGFLAEFYKVSYSSTKIFSCIFLGAIISFFTNLTLSKLKSTRKWKQLSQKLLIIWYRKKSQI